MISKYSPLLDTYLDKIRLAAKIGPILDLACGSGRNGLYLIENQVPVVFADNAPSALEKVQHKLDAASYRDTKQLASLWRVDFEQPDVRELVGAGQFGGIIIFRYLHRPLLAQIKQAIKPGGIVIYETFTADQAMYGRPKNPDFLLREGELRECFSTWQVLHSFEGTVENQTPDKPAAIAQIVAIKPLFGEAGANI